MSGTGGGKKGSGKLRVEMSRAAATSSEGWERDHNEMGLGRNESDREEA